MTSGKSATMGDWLRQTYQRARCHTIRCTPSDFRPTSFFPSRRSIFSSSSKTSTAHLRVRKAARLHLVALIPCAFLKRRHPPQGLKRRLRRKVGPNNLASSLGKTHVATRGRLLRRPLFDTADAIRRVKI